MNHIEFFPYHNRLITFMMKNDPTLKEGVVFDTNYETKEKHTHYIFVERKNVKDWTSARIANNTKAMKALETVIDIEDIVEAENEVDKVVNKAVSHIISKNPIPDSLKHLFEIQEVNGILKIVRINKTENKVMEANTVNV